MTDVTPWGDDDVVRDVYIGALTRARDNARSLKQTMNENESDDGFGTAQLRESETRDDDNTHTSVNEQQVEMLREELDK